MIENDLRAIERCIIAAVDSAFDRRFEPFRAQAMANFEKLFGNDEKREQEYLTITNQLERVDARLDKVEGQLNEINSELMRHGTLLDALDQRVTRLE